jgi:hypothetical protein
MPSDEEVEARAARIEERNAVQAQQERDLAHAKAMLEVAVAMREASLRADVPEQARLVQPPRPALPVDVLKVVQRFPSERRLNLEKIGQDLDAFMVAATSAVATCERSAAALALGARTRFLKEPPALDTEDMVLDTLLHSILSAIVDGKTGQMILSFNEGSGVKALIQLTESLCPSNLGHAMLAMSALNAGSVIDEREDPIKMLYEELALYQDTTRSSAALACCPSWCSSRP